jgi:CheY-like chemotaxis protein
MSANRIESRQVQRTKGFRRQLPLPLDPNLCGGFRVNASAEFPPIQTRQRSDSKITGDARAVRCTGSHIGEYFESRLLPRLFLGLNTGTSPTQPFSPLAARVSSLGEGAIMALPINILIICAGKEEQAKFTEMVRMAGMRAVCCANLQEARVILARQEIHAVICEEILPDGSFHDVIEQVRPASEELPVIVFSNSSEWDTYLRVMRAGAFDCIAYPPESAEVARILWQALRQSKQHIEMAMAAS